jgi:hypothetical protein
VVLKQRLAVRPPRLITLAAMRRRGLVVLVLSSLLAVSAESASAFRSNWFQSPSGNIRCRYFTEGDVMACNTLNNGRVAVVPVRGQAYVLARLTDFTFPRGPVLHYGDYWSLAGRFRCDSYTYGMRCRSLRSGRGFLVSRSGFRTF